MRIQIQYVITGSIAFVPHWCFTHPPPRNLQSLKRIARHTNLLHSQNNRYRLLTPNLFLQKERLSKARQWTEACWVFFCRTFCLVHKRFKPFPDTERISMHTTWLICLQFQCLGQLKHVDWCSRLAGPRQGRQGWEWRYSQSPPHLRIPRCRTWIQMVVLELD